MPTPYRQGRPEGKLAPRTSRWRLLRAWFNGTLKRIEVRTYCKGLAELLEEPIPVKDRRKEYENAQVWLEGSPAPGLWESLEDQRRFQQQHPRCLAEHAREMGRYA